MVMPDGVNDSQSHSSHLRQKHQIKKRLESLLISMKVGGN